MNRYTGLKSSFSIIIETDTFILIKDNDEANFASVTTAADYTVATLSQMTDLTNRKVIYQDSMKRFDELCHSCGNFSGFQALTVAQQMFYKKFVKEYEAKHQEIKHG